MKITSTSAVSTNHPHTSNPQRQNPQPAPASLPFTSDLPRKPAHRKPVRRRAAVATTRTPRKRSAGGAAVGKRTGPATPLLQWKFNEAGDGESGSVKDEVTGFNERPPVVDVEDGGGRKARRSAKGGGGVVSARKLAAALWRLHAPDDVVDGGAGGAERASFRNEKDRLGFMHGTSRPGDRLTTHHRSRESEIEAKDQPRSPCSVNGPMNGYICEPQASLKFSNYAMEGVTKWDPVCPKKNDEDDNSQFDEELNAISTVSALQSELEQARARIEILESERRSSKKKVEHFLRKLSEERAAWRSREHEKVRAIIDDSKADLSRERRNRQRLESVNSKLVNELAEAKQMAKRYMQEYEKERKSRQLVEEVCEELAQEMGEDKAEIEALKKDCVRIREEAEEERKMLQMAEVWREERVQMKLVDAKVALEEKHSQMNKLVQDLKNLLRSKSVDLDGKEMKEVVILQDAVDSVEIKDVKEFSYDPPRSSDIYSVFEEMGMGMMSEREIEPCEDDDRSGWETASHVDDPGSCYSPEGSFTSVNRGGESPATDVSEVCSVPSKQSKKASSISRLWRSGPNNGDSYKIISLDGVKARLSNGRISSGSGVTSLDLGSQWSSPEKGNAQGGKGCIEWPRAHKGSLKAKLMEARMESQKIQLRQVLKQKI